MGLFIVNIHGDIEGDYEIIKQISSAEPCREADDYENEIADLHNRLDIAEYDKERYKEEITILEAENKKELTNEKAIAFLQDNGWLVEHDRIMTSGMENKGKWISVSERLPKAFETVLRTRVENGWNGTTYTIIDTGCICPSDYNIVAWMPLPEPYKEKE